MRRLCIVYAKESMQRNTEVMTQYMQISNLCQNFLWCIWHCLGNNNIFQMTNSRKFLSVGMLYISAGVILISQFLFRQQIQWSLFWPMWSQSQLLTLFGDGNLIIELCLFISAYIMTCAQLLAPWPLMCSNVLVFVVSPVQFPQTRILQPNGANCPDGLCSCGCPCVVSILCQWILSRKVLRPFLTFGYYQRIFSPF